MEMAASTDWLLQVAVLSSAVVALVAARRRSAASSVVPARRSCRPRFPSPGGRVAAATGSVDLREDGVVHVGAGRGAGRRCSQGAEDRRLPSCWRDPPSPRSSGGVGGGIRRRSVLRGEEDIGAQEDLVVFFIFVLDCSVRTEV